MKRLLCLLFFSLYCFLVFSQGKKEEIPDSLKIYKKVEAVAKKKKLTYWLYKEIFNLPDQKKKKEKQRKQVSYQVLQGGIIRRIDVLTYDPFGYSVNDSTQKPKGFIQKGGNLLHQRTRRSTIISRLLFSVGDTLDPLKVKESERILRQNAQVREIVILVTPVKGSDSVDVLVKEQDYWSKGFGVAIESDRYAFNFSDKNFLGLGHYFENNLRYDRDSSRYINSGTYSIPYLFNTLIIPTFYYSSDKYNFLRGVTVSRPFISPFIKWAGSVELFDTKISGREILPDADTVDYSTRFFSKDFWLGRSFSIGKDTSEETRSTRLILGARYSITNFKYHPPEVIAPPSLYEDTRRYLFGIGLSNRTYYRDYYIYRFGVNEDVPAGRLIQLTGGYETKKSMNRPYAAIEARSGNHFDNIGYITLNGGFGTYFRHGLDESVLKLGIGYFSDLLELGRVRIRQFIKVRITYGLNRNDEVAINLNDAIKGFESDDLTGTKKAGISLQTQAYLPYQFLGFRFAPFVFFNAGLISDESSPLTKSKLYQGFGIGLIIKNELLVINTFQFAIGIYPYMPGKKGVTTRFNPVKTYDFTFDDFQIQRPAVIPFN